MTALGDFSPGDVLTAADLNAFNNVTALYDTSTIVVANTTVVNIAFGSGTELCDQSGWHSETSNTDRITPTIAGTYLVVANANLETASFPTSSRFYVSVAKNGTNYLNSNFTSPKYPGATIACTVNLNGTTDYVSMQLYQDSGSSKNTTRRNLTCMLLRAS